MEPMNSRDLIDKAINNQDMVLLYFKGESCSVCLDLKPKIEGILNKYPRIKGITINIESHPALGGAYSIFTIPSVLLFIEGKETIREGRHISIRDLDNKINRYYSLLF